MKRKLNEEDVPTPVAEQQEEPARSTVETESSSSAIQSFDALHLDTRLLQAIAKESFSVPTPVQSRAIPLILEGQDVLARAVTGSGKTAAYVLPVIQSILQKKHSSSKTARNVSALILVPTNELADQVTKVIGTFSSFCAKDVRAVNLTQKVADAVQRSLLAEQPDIVVATPARAQVHLGNSDLKLDGLKYVVLDEPDLLIDYQHEENLKIISQAIPEGSQAIMVSATLNSEVDKIKALFCKDPAVLELDVPGDNETGVSQYYVKCAEDEKFLLLYVIFKLKLVKGKCIIFVADIDRSYRLKLYLEQFGIRSCVLNSELPVNTRIHVVEEFNKNVYDIIIASDEHEVIGSEELHKKGNRVSPDQDEHEEGPAKKRRTSKKKRDKEYGVSRGVDFKNVACVLNFDLPPSTKSYIHRIGRTGRAGRSGMALSFVVSKDQQGKHKPTSIASTANDEDVLDQIIKSQEKRKQKIEDHPFDEKAVDAFRYRMNDALRAVTGVAIREARTRELRQELINSERLKRHFEENPDDLHHLRHDSELRAARVQTHLKHVPDYLMPSADTQVTKDIGFVGFKKSGGGNRIREARARNRAKGRGKPAKKDPLKTFSARLKK